MDIKQKHIKLILIIIVLVFSVSGVLYSTIQLLNNEKEKDVNSSIQKNDSLTLMDEEDIDEAILNKGYSEEDIDSMSSEQKDKIVMGIDYYYEDNKVRLYSDSKNAVEYSGETDKLYQTFVEYIVDGNYQQIITETKLILEDFNLTKGKNLQLAAIYSDAVRMSEYFNLDKAGKEAMLQSHKDPNGLVANTLYAYVRRREAVILDMMSKTPVFKGSYSIDSCEMIEEENEDFEYYAKMWNGEMVRNVYKVELTLPEAPDMFAIVLESADGKLRIAGYYGDTYNKFLTVAERKELGIDKE